MIPAALSFLLAWLALREPEHQLAPLKPSPFFAGFRHLDPETKRLLVVGFLFTLARFSEAFLILKGMEAGLSRSVVAAGAGAVQPRLCRARLPRRGAQRPDEPADVLLAGIGVLIGGNLVLAIPAGLAGLIVGVTLWGAHMALTQGIFARMIADSAPGGLARDQLRRLLVRQRDRLAAREPRRGAAVGPRRKLGDVPRQRGAGRGCVRDAQPAAGRSPPCPITTGSSIGSRNGGMRPDARSGAKN